MAAKYQVFVSSTYEDLASERDIVIRAILEMGHIPVGMEMFSAADEEQWKIIARHIDESDYYCVIVAHRYGSAIGGTSFTRKEYEYAVGGGTPVLGFVIDDTASWPKNRVDTDPVDVTALGEFKALVKARPVSFWRNADDLYGKVSIALSKAFTAYPRDGWVRASEISGPEVTRELTRLSAENAEFRTEIVALEQKMSADKTRALTELGEKLADLERSFDYKYTRQDGEWSTSEAFAYLSYFNLLSPYLMNEVELRNAAADLAMEIRGESSQTWWTVAINQVRDLFSDFAALGIIEPSRRKHAVSDNGEYWSLTELGRDLHAHVRRRLLDRKLRKDGVGEQAEPEEPEEGIAASLGHDDANALTPLT